MNSPTLYIFSGLPASGKSTLAQQLAKRLGATYIRIDTVEQGLKELCDFKVEGEGYRLSYRIIHDNLVLGNHAIADSCNPIELTRKEWEEVATEAGAQFVNVEIKCSDLNEHRLRVNTRRSSIENFRLPTWEDVQNRHYEPWRTDIISIDTAGQSVEASFSELVKQLGV